jgi:hypothetical protein
VTVGEDFNAAGLVNFSLAHPGLNRSFYVDKNYLSYGQGKRHKLTSLVPIPPILQNIIFGAICHTSKHYITL